MSLPAGVKLGSFEIVSRLGSGGMGEVYRARDSKLHRDVAIKVLLPAVADDPDRLARFGREAQLLASLNHPNIAQIHGLEEGAGVRALVMELVEGEDLSARLARGPLPLDEALLIAQQIAEALEAAHDHGIVHRDLKPANIKLRHDGAVKVLDFGLAKAIDPRSGSAGGNIDALAQSPTISLHGTVAGVVLGTAAYMSPEQARGRVVDRRADIWAFGCVLFEILTGAPAFVGADATEILVAVLSRQPAWQALPPAVPPGIRRLLRLCLEKDPRRRLDSAAVLRLEIDAVTEQSAAEPSDTAPSETVGGTSGREHLSGPSRLVVALLAGFTGAALVAAILWIATRNGVIPPSEVTRTFLSTAPADTLQAEPGDQTLGEGRPSRTAFALSPDGRTVVFSAVADGRQQLYMRRLDQLAATPLAGTEGAHTPFFSPDGEWIGFQAGRLIKKVPVAGGSPPTTLCEASPLFGATWSTSRTIVFAITSGGLWRVPEEGGIPQVLTTVDPVKGEYSHRLPHFLPDGQTVIFTVIPWFLPNWDDARLWAVSLATGERRPLGAGADARYVSSGHLLYMRSGTLVAATFDASTGEIGTGRMTVLDDVMQAANMTNEAYDSGGGQFAVAAGALLYVAGGIFPEREKTIVIADRQGRLTTLAVPTRPYFAPHLSPDGTRLVVWTQGLDRNVWIYSLERGTLTRLTMDGRNHRAIWTPDGKRITYSGSTGGGYSLFWVPADGSGPPERLTTGDTTPAPSAWSPDGQTLMLMERDSNASEFRVVAMSLSGDRKPKSISQSRFEISYPEFSSDGRWLAFVSSESGRSEVYVQPYPGPGPRRQVSTDGGYAPAWSRNGRELFYTTATSGHIRMMAVPITQDPFTAGPPRTLFEGVFSLQALTRGYDVSADGQRFFLTQAKERPLTRANQMVLVQNWVEELKQRLPVQ